MVYHLNLCGLERRIMKWMLYVKRLPKPADARVAVMRACRLDASVVAKFDRVEAESYKRNIDQ
jgi:hypothetical protein